MGCGQEIMKNYSILYRDIIIDSDLRKLKKENEIYLISTKSIPNFIKLIEDSKILENKNSSNDQVMEQLEISLSDLFFRNEYRPEKGIKIYSKFADCKDIMYENDDEKNEFIMVKKNFIEKIGKAGEKNVLLKLEKNKNQIYFPDDELSLDFIYKRKGICKFVDLTTSIEENKNNYQENISFDQKEKSFNKLNENDKDIIIKKSKNKTNDKDNSSNLNQQVINNNHIYDNRNNKKELQISNNQNNFNNKNEQKVNNKDLYLGEDINLNEEQNKKEEYNKIKNSIHFKGTDNIIDKPDNLNNNSLQNINIENNDIKGTPNDIDENNNLMNNMKVIKINNNVNANSNENNNININGNNNMVANNINNGNNIVNINNNDNNNMVNNNIMNNNMINNNMIDNNMNNNMLNNGVINNNIIENNMNNHMMNNNMMSNNIMSNNMINNNMVNYNMMNNNMINNNMMSNNMMSNNMINNNAMNDNMMKNNMIDFNWMNNNSMRNNNNMINNNNNMINNNVINNNLNNIINSSNNMNNNMNNINIQPYNNMINQNNNNDIQFFPNKQFFGMDNGNLSSNANNGNQIDNYGMNNSNKMMLNNNPIFSDNNNMQNNPMNFNININNNNNFNFNIMNANLPQLFFKNNKNINQNQDIKSIYKDELSKFKEPPLIGLANIGATCYMNATLQCLSNINLLTGYFLHNKHKFMNMPINSTKKQISKALSEVIYHLWNPNEPNKYYSPNNFKEIISSKNSLFAGIQANDSKDLLIFLFENIHKELNTLIDPSTVNNEFTDQKDPELELTNCRKNYYNCNKSIITDLFYFDQANITKCTNCGTSIYNFAMHNILIFPLEKTRLFKAQKGINFESVNIKDCFECHVNAEVSKQGETFYCNTCHQEANYILENKISSYPEILCIVLNRGNHLEFDVDFMITYLLDGKEMDKYLINLDCNKSELGTKYELIGIIIHSGNSGMDGHFFTYCRSPINKKWYWYNDAMVSKIEDPHQEIKGIPYLLFYQKKRK